MRQGTPKKNRSKKRKKPTKNKYLKAHKRRSQRGSYLGRRFESKTMVNLLKKMKKDGKILDFVYHEPNSYEDSEGKDFTVHQQGKMSEILKRSFGVTISYNCQQRSKKKHPDTPQLFFPHKTKPEIIEKRILDLFKKHSMPQR